MTIHIRNSIKEVFDKEFNNSWQIKLLKEWNLIIGDLKTKVQIEKINNDCIFLIVSDACWMQELYLLSNLIINKINFRLGEPRIKFIRFKQAKLKSFNNANEKKNKNFEKIKNINLNSLELNALKKINDPQLSNVLKNFLIKCYEK